MPESVPPTEPPAPPPSDESAPLRTFEYGFDRPRRLGPFALVLAALVGAILAGGAVAAAFLLVDRGGSDVDADRQTAASIAAILALSGDSESRFDEFIASTPDSLPEDVPAHPDARLVVSYRLTLADGTDTYLLVSRVDEAEDAVVSYFLEALDEDPWQVTGGSSSPDLVAVQFSSVEDPDVQGAVNIRSPNQGTTTILTVVQAPHEDTGEPPVEESRALPPDFPSEVPVYPEAVVTDAAFLKQPGSTRFFLSALTRDDIAAVMDFYRDAFEEQGWNVDDASASGEDTMSFNDPDERFTGAVTASEDDAHEGYTRIDLVVDRSTREEN
ncbi:MAG TPA: hypothetical protein VNM43_01280 [Dehalococcoidia bacterium]|nr:hypothetical protein [Dehalococcoidia bacterium]